MAAGRHALVCAVLVVVAAVFPATTEAQLATFARRVLQREDLQRSSFVQAQQRCSASGGVPASIRSTQEQAQADAMRRLLAPGATLWCVLLSGEGRREEKGVREE